MNLNALLQKFLNLPPAVMLLLALGGFGSLASVLFFILPALRTREAQKWLIIILIAGIVLYGLIFLLRWLFFRKRAGGLTSALASQGPTRGDIAEQEQIYRQKFNAKLAELKTNGLSVYRLPWFLLIGEPGCGKTASLIHSGLDFPLGRDEVPGFGGTRNYNWWFTNEAVILDTAGRISFHEEGTTDKTEWEYFLKMLRQHRARCPVNGVIIALPADKLLRDTSEQRQQKATIIRERLRQIHQQLGVRIPAFVLITKMDLVGGFSEFFEEVRQDLQLRNQMVGWSRPGPFQEPFDPAAFSAAFESVFSRMRDWAMRYLQRKAPEPELGLVATFPESLRAMRGPLNEYIGAIFQKSPLIEPPFFRGFYFTSAVQEGAPILDILTRSQSGARLAPRPGRAVDSKAFFIHDFYAGKVFPESGLVFRSAKHAALNKRARWLVWAGSGAMVALLLTLFGVGAYSVSGLISRPRDDCAKAVKQISEGGATLAGLPDNLKLAGQLDEHVAAYNSTWGRVAARMLFIGASLRTPQGYVQEIHAAYALKCLVKPVLDAVAARLGSSEAVPPLGTPEHQRWVEALAAYASWYGDRVGGADTAALDGEGVAARYRREFDALLAFSGVGENEQKQTAAQFAEVLTGLAGEKRSFAADVISYPGVLDPAAATGTLRTAIGQLAKSWEAAARLDASTPDEAVKYWYGFLSRVAALYQRYDSLLKTRDKFAGGGDLRETVQHFQKLSAGAATMNEAPTAPDGSIADALATLKAFLDTSTPPTAAGQIIRLTGLLEVMSKRWKGEFDAVRAALQRGAPDPNAAPQSQVYAALRGGEDSLAAAFRTSRDALLAQLSLRPEDEPLEALAKAGLIVVDDGPTPAGGRIGVRLAPSPLGPSNEFRGYVADLSQMASGGADSRRLDDIRNWVADLESLKGGQPSGALLAGWFKKVADDPSAEAVAKRVTHSGLRANLFWRPADLYALSEAVRDSWRDRLLGAMLEKTQRTLAVDKAAAFSMPGVGRLLPDFAEASERLPFDQNRFNSRNVPAAPAPAAPKPTPPPAQPQPPPDEFGGAPSAKPAEAPAKPDEPAAAVASPPAAEERGALLRRYHTRENLAAAVTAAEAVKQLVGGLPGGDGLRAALDSAAGAYVDGYFGDWSRVYDEPVRLLPVELLELLDAARRGALDWPGLVSQLKDARANLGASLAARQNALMTDVALVDRAFDTKRPDGAAARKRISDRLTESKPAVWEALKPLRQVAQPDALGQQLIRAWSGFAAAVAAIGPLEAGGSAGAQRLPDRKSITKDFGAEGGLSANSPLVAPLLDLADYSETLLLNRVQRVLHESVKGAAGKFPVVQGVAGQAMSVKEFLEFMQKVGGFQSAFAELSRRLDEGSDTRQCIDRVEAWRKFLFGEKPVSGEPELAKVWLETVYGQTGPGKVSVDQAYGKLTIQLPLLNANAGPAEPITRSRELSASWLKSADPREALAALKTNNYFWQLRDAPFPPTRVEISDRNATTQGQPTLTGMSVPGESWSLLRLLSESLGDGYWKIQVDVPTGGAAGSVTFAIALRILGPDGKATYPGTITPPADPGAPPGMSAAERYLRRVE